MNTLKILVLHGPNLNLLGMREPDHYGASTLADINQQLADLAGTMDIDIDNYQSNHEGELVDRIHQAVTDGIDGIVINPAAYTHTSIALRDALLASNIPFVEVHLSNIHKREAFRHKSMLADAAIGVVTGFGATSYAMALNGINQQLRNR